MTVGIAAAAENDSESPYAIVSADRLVTTQQQSAIEHEHPDTKIETLAREADSVHALGVVAGAVNFGEDLIGQIENHVVDLLGEEPGLALSVQNVAEIGGVRYRNLMQTYVQDAVLSKYGLQMEDLSRQHQFKDDFFQALMSEVKDVHHAIQNNLTLLIGGVDEEGAHVYEVTGGNVVGHNSMGYAAIGSGKQPAESEYIQSRYSATTDLEEGIATAVAAVCSSREARGVGQRMDIGIASQSGTTMLDDDVIGDLVDRQDEINQRQQRAKREVLSEQSVEIDIDQ